MVARSCAPHFRDQLATQPFLRWASDAVRYREALPGSVALVRHLGGYESRNAGAVFDGVLRKAAGVTARVVVAIPLETRLQHN